MLLRQLIVVLCLSILGQADRVLAQKKDAPQPVYQSDIDILYRERDRAEPFCRSAAAHPPFPFLYVW